MSDMHFQCPSCNNKLKGIEPAENHTQVVKRTCSLCGDRWQLVVKPMSRGGRVRLDKAVITFVDNVWTRRQNRGGR